jgi:hypothetical protein
MDASRCCAFGEGNASHCCAFEEAGGGFATNQDPNISEQFASKISEQLLS